MWHYESPHNLIHWINSMENHFRFPIHFSPDFNLSTTTILDFSFCFAWLWLGMTIQGKSSLEMFFFCCFSTHRECSETLMILKYKYFLARIVWICVTFNGTEMTKNSISFSRLHRIFIPAISSAILSAMLWVFFPVYTRRNCLNSKTLVCSIKMPKNSHIQKLKYTTKDVREEHSTENLLAL